MLKLMENERLTRAIARIEQAAAKLGDVAPAAPSGVDPAELTQLSAEFDSIRAAHQAEQEDRERTIAKLRGVLQNRQEPLDSAEIKAAHEVLEQKYAALRKAAASTLAGLDRLIDQAESSGHG